MMSYAMSTVSEKLLKIKQFASTDLDKEFDSCNVGIFKNIGNDRDKCFSFHHTSYHITDAHLNKRKCQTGRIK